MAALQEQDAVASLPFSNLTPETFVHTALSVARHGRAGAGSAPCAAAACSAHGLRLSPRQREVLGLLSEDLPDQVIAARLYVTPSTVRTHIHHLQAALAVERLTGSHATPDGAYLRAR